MKRLLILIIALMMVLMTAGIAGAHIGFRISIGLPLFFGYSYPAYYGYPAPYGYYYQPTVRVYANPYKPGTVIENISVNGRLVEQRVKVLDDRYEYGPYPRHGRR